VIPKFFLMGTGRRSFGFLTLPPIAGSKEQAPVSPVNVADSNRAPSRCFQNQKTGTLSITA